MRLGLIHINMGPMSRPDALVQAARTAEQAGFDSVWAGEHLVLPDPQVPPSPMAPQDPALDSLLALTWAAAHTATIRLATGIVILPQPVQRPIPLVVGGHSAPAYRRAVARAHGWYGYWLTPAQAAESLAGLAAARTSRITPPNVLNPGFHGV
jgi:alkanesulfonate monooxygenase SsuD/methylene tetrahydromethanopterin reductase-like flavin-dependent oxidoreductase (luciferase family)